MAKINGFFETFLDNELHSKLHGRSNAIRVYCMIRFKTEFGFSEPYPAIIDTGAHTSLIPSNMWKSSEHKLIGDHYVKGLVPDAKLDVKVGEITLLFADLLNASKEYPCLCSLSPHDRTPLILGFKDLLSKIKLVVDYPENKVWLEE